MMSVKQIFHGHHHVHYRATLKGDIKVIGTPIARVVNEQGEII